MKNYLRPITVLLITAALALGACGGDTDESAPVEEETFVTESTDEGETPAADGATTGSGSETSGDEFIDEYTALNGQVSRGGVPFLDVDLPDDHLYDAASEDEIRALLGDGDGVIYFGFPSCPWCRNAVPPLDEAGKETGIERIHYVNPSDMRDQGPRRNQQETSEYYEFLLDELGEFAPEHPQRPGERTILVPLVATVTDGEIVSAHLGSAPSQTDPSQPLTDSQREELIGIYVDQFSQIP